MTDKFKTIGWGVSLPVEHGGPESVMEKIEHGLEKFVRKAHNRFVLHAWAAWARENAKAFARRNRDLIIEMEETLVAVGLAIEDDFELDELIAECNPPMLSSQDAQAVLQACAQIEERKRAEELMWQSGGIDVLTPDNA